MNSAWKAVPLSCPDGLPPLGRCQLQAQLLGDSASFVLQVPEAPAGQTTFPLCSGCVSTQEDPARFPLSDKKVVRRLEGRNQSIVLVRFISAGTMMTSEQAGATVEVGPFARLGWSD